MAEQLTQQQKMAVTNRGGRLLVSAAAGSGKTKVLVDRLLSYLTDQTDPANIDDFLIITYTKAAASELRGKIADKLTQYIANHPENRHMQRQMERLYLTKISTVHSFCGDILREYAYTTDIPGDFRVAEEGEIRQLQDHVLDQVLEEAYTSREEKKNVQAFVDTQGLSRNDALLPEIILQVYNSARCHKSPDKWLKRCLEDLEVRNDTDVSETVWGSYMIRSLHRKLAQHTEALNNVMKLAQTSEGMEKAAFLLAETINQIQKLGAYTHWDQIVAHKEIDYGRISFSKHADPDLKGQVMAVRDACKKGLAKALRAFSDTSEQILRDTENCSQAAQGLAELVEHFSEQFEKAKRSRRILDFSDLEHKTLDLLLGKSRSGPTEISKEIAHRFREIMVDEYQDSNQVQDAIFTTLTMKRQNCFMVGDVKQSIYQFRLADPQIFLDKYNSYEDASNAADGASRKVLLSSNFRSSGSVIEAVNHVFSCCMSPEVGGLEYGEAEMLREGIPHLPEVEPEVEFHAIDVRNDSYTEEASYTAQRISELLDGTHTVRELDHFRPIRPEDIVILLRSPGSVGMEFCRALEQRGIPCTMGGGEDLLKTEEVGLLYALLQVIDNPLQDIPLVAVLSSRVFMFTADELAELRSSRRKAPFIQAVKSSDNPKAKRFIELLTDLRLKARMCSAAQLIEYIFSKTYMDSIFGAMNDTGERINNLQSFCQIAASYESMCGKDLGQFIEYVQMLSDKGMLISADKNAAGSVTIMSIHKSKGLEFPVVFLSALARSFNQESLREQVLCHKELGLGLTCTDRLQRVRYPSLAKKAIALKMQEESISEELRILYVAMTRAKDRLIMTYAPRNLASALSEISNRMPVTPPEMMHGEVTCPGEWIACAALRRTEAGALFAIAGKSAVSEVSEKPWLITVQQQISQSQHFSQQDMDTQQKLSEAVIGELQEGLSFVYPHDAATKMPSKQTATQLKGRSKDMEASENSPMPWIPSFRGPLFGQLQQSGTMYGNLVHTIMQYLDFKNCGTDNGIQSELKRLVQQGTLSQEQVEMIDPKILSGFFQSHIGKRFMDASRVLKEFKFSVLMDGKHFAPCNDGERVLVQGVVDCALVEDDGIVVVDFKTDNVNESTLQDAVQRYRAQVEVYSDALSQIYEKVVKESYLYFFKIQQFVKV